MMRHGMLVSDIFPSILINAQAQNTHASIPLVSLLYPSSHPDLGEVQR
jgi:hypothetical protein